MRIEELDDSSPVDFVIVQRDCRSDVYGNDEKKGKKVRRLAMSIVRVDAKRALVGIGGRFLFYPTLIYNVVRNKFQSEFRWWDQVDQFLLLGAVPFPTDVPRLKQLGVGGVITLNEPFETLVPSSLYYAYGIDHLVIPTRDYLFAPSFLDINRAVDFIHRNTLRGQTTFVHCKAGRGRSTTVVLCYLVVKKNMTPSAALEYVRAKRPRVRLAPAQWKAVEEFKKQHVAFTSMCSLSGDGVLITQEDLEGYHGPRNDKSGNELIIVPRSEKSSPMMVRLSCLFASLRGSGYSGRPVVRQLTEARAY